MVLSWLQINTHTLKYDITDGYRVWRFPLSCDYHSISSHLNITIVLTGENPIKKEAHKSDTCQSSGETKTIGHYITAAACPRAFLLNFDLITSILFIQTNKHLNTQ